MLKHWMAFVVISGILPGMCKISFKYLTNIKEHSRGLKYDPFATGEQPFQFVKRSNVSPSKRSADETPKHGSFKIEDGNVIGGGIYEIKKDSVDIDIKIKIVPDFKTSSNEQTSPKTTSSPSGSETTAAPSGPETTAAPSGPETTAAPSGPETTAAPSGSETTAAPSGSETTAAPSGSKTTAVPSGSNTTAAPSGSDVEQEGLTLHNKFRKIHGVPEMKLNAEMSKSAASYAAELAKSGSLRHSSREARDNTGENLSYGCSSSKGQTATEAVTNWYNEVCSPGYSFGSENAGGAGHFTQVVWKESVELGFGKADIEKNKMKCTYYVGRYKKAGNMGGEYAKNVPKGNFQQSYCNTIKS